MSPVPRVVRNDWSSVAVPDLDIRPTHLRPALDSDPTHVRPAGGWRPTMTVSVVIPAFEGQPTLDLTLASLCHQTYPTDLLEVIVVDDGSDPPLQLPAVRPQCTTLLRVSEGWGKANALRIGVAFSTGEILHLLDADMVVFPEHVAALARWHHALPYAVTLGYKRFVDPVRHRPWPSPDEVVDAWIRGAADGLFGGSPGEPHGYQERYIAQTDQLRSADHLAFRIHVGATIALRRELYDAAGGPDPQLRFGNDTEFGYRLAQAGAVFVPEPLARSWHLGPTHVMRARGEIARCRLAFLADLVPYPRHWRRVGGTTWTVPLVELAVAVGDEPLERVRATVDTVLKGTERDVRVNLVGPWDRLEPARVPALSDPQLDLRLIAATYRGEPRVRLVTERPESAFPSPYLLELPAGCGLAPDSVQRLIEHLDQQQAGVVRVVPPGIGSGQAVGGGVKDVLFWRTAALSRARWVRGGDESLLDAVASLHGRRDMAADDVGVVDLTGFEPRELAVGIANLSGPGRRRSRLVPSTVEVEGVRSLARAAVVVAWLGGRRLRAWLAGVTRR
jgi:glycosyltransferase involved in cell wall biosynthesis